MMRALLSGCLLMCNAAFAGYDGSENYNFYPQLEGYDADTGSYFHTLKLNDVESQQNYSSKSGDSSVIANLFIYNPSNQAHRHIFSKYYGAITAIIVESGFSAESNTMTYLMDSGRIAQTAKSPRKTNQNIIIETLNSKTKTYTVWKANKTAGDPKVLFSYSAPSVWHLDAQNQTIRLISSTQENKHPRLKITNFAW